MSKAGVFIVVASIAVGCSGGVSVVGDSGAGDVVSGGAGDADDSNPQDGSSASYESGAADGNGGSYDGSSPADAADAVADVAPEVADAIVDVGPEAEITDAPHYDGPMPASQAFVSAILMGGSLSGVNDTQVCGNTVGLQMQLGNAVQPLPVVVTDGSNQAGQSVHLTCAVDGTSSGYAIQLSATVNGMGSIFISGSNLVSSGSMTGLSASFTYMGVTYADSFGCVLSYSYNGAPLPAGGAPAPGRIWAHIECDHATANGMYATLPDGTQVPRTCELSADFLFQNCS
jgi:hypothetical protein